jgi:hypothetical protein
VSVDVRRLLRLGAAAVGAVGVIVCAAAWTPAHAQHPTEQTEFMFSNLRPTGQPVIPIFDGWFQKPDGTYDLCFGYFNLNTKQTLEIPIGKENFIEPAKFNGGQPTHFLPVPPPPNLYRRYFCTFVVNVPADFGRTAKVVWTLRVNDRDFSVPGHLGSVNYKIQELSAKEAGRSSVAPVVKFMPAGPEARGRSGVTLGPLSVAVGQPLPLSLSVTGPPPGPETFDPDASDDEERPYVRNGKKRLWWVKFAKHHGPGDISFAPGEVDIWEGENQAATQATFSKAGDYLIRIQAIDNPSENASYQFHCCWTNAFVKVSVK